MFILREDRPGNSLEEWEHGWRCYQEYLAINRQRIPVSAYEFATANWHYDFRSHQCPHDAWVESVKLLEKASGKRSEVRELQIKLRLFGAYHDGYIEIEYVGVKKYDISAELSCHGDWLYDEVRLAEDGSVIHEIEFSNAHWLVECRDIQYKWLPRLE